jgi:polysaccharide pyruvyl transferase WcaK-like protein
LEKKTLYISSVYEVCAGQVGRVSKLVTRSWLTQVVTLGLTGLTQYQVFVCIGGCHVDEIAFLRWEAD